MKNLLIITVLMINTTVLSQNHFNQWVISGGATYNFLRGIHKVPFNDYQKDFKFTVGANLNADWGLVRRVSLGFGMVHQRHHLTISNYSYTIDGQTFVENPIQSISSTSYNLRFLIHFRTIYENSIDEVDLYWGGMQQFIFVRSANSSKDPDFYTIKENFDAIPAIVGGVRYYPTEQVGLHFEMAFPSNYTISLGLAYRFKNK